MTIKSELLAKRGPKLVPTIFAGVDCFIRLQTAGERIRFRLYHDEIIGRLKKIQEKLDAGENIDLEEEEAFYVMCKIVADAICDADGNLIFGGKDGFKIVGEYDAGEVEDCFERIKEANRRKEHEEFEAAKKSTATPS